MEMQTKANEALAKVHALYTPPPQPVQPPVDTGSTAATAT